MAKKAKAAKTVKGAKTQLKKFRAGMTKGQKADVKKAMRGAQKQLGKLAGVKGSVNP